MYELATLHKSFYWLNNKIIMEIHFKNLLESIQPSSVFLFFFVIDLCVQIAYDRSVAENGRQENAKEQTEDHKRLAQHLSGCSIAVISAANTCDGIASWDAFYYAAILFVRFIAASGHSWCLAFPAPHRSFVGHLRNRFILDTFVVGIFAIGAVRSFKFVEAFRCGQSVTVVAG